MSEKAVLYGTVVGLGLLGVTLFAACIVCKICISSKKARHWSGLDKVISRRENSQHEDDPCDNKKHLSKESDLMLKMQKGEYVGYDTLERDISIPKLPDFSYYPTIGDQLPVVSPQKAERKEEATPSSSDSIGSHSERILTTSTESKSLEVTHDTPESTVDMNDLKSSVCNRHGQKTPINGYHRERSHSFHNSYTIYEESSDQSGTDSLPRSLTQIDNHSDSETRSHSSVDESASETSGSSSSTLLSQELASSQELLSQHLSGSSLGQVEYSLQYHRELGQLVLTILQAQHLDLPVDGSGKLPDTYIKAFSSSCHDLDPKKQTKVCKATANPTFKENFIFRITEKDFLSAFITLQIFSRNHYARQTLVGEIVVRLHPLCDADTYRTWSNILDYDHQPSRSCGEINVSLQYCALSEELSVHLTELKSLKLEYSPVYPKKALFLTVTHFSELNQPKLKKRTCSHLAAVGSKFLSLEGKSLQFTQIPLSVIKGSQLLIELCEEYPDKSHGTLGYAILGAGTTDTEYAHWLMLVTKATNTDQSSISMWHDLHIIPRKATRSRPQLYMH
ncbi:Syt12 [Bugula neritina]|uniref:Syt12 n=1 Tax=Bugula neritina TaxID=10212 RepID=A0A7J7JV85_BUGNE|nr:Syt12 [Bugula neritina]